MRKGYSLYLLMQREWIWKMSIIKISNCKLHFIELILSSFALDKAHIILYKHSSKTRPHAITYWKFEQNKALSHKKKKKSIH